MLWGESQALIQTLIALDLSYFTFKEIRRPYIALEETRLDELLALVENEKHFYAHDHAATVGASVISGRIAILQIELSQLSSFSDLWDRVMLLLALVMAAVNLALLLASALWYRDPMPLWAWGTMAVGLAPILYAFAVNGLSLAAIIRRIERPRQRLERDIFALWAQAGESRLEAERLGQDA